MRIVKSEKEWLENEIKIKQVMTRMPYTASPEISIFEAKRKMKELRIRHLPVLDQGELVGIVTDRDVRTAETFHGTGYLAVGDAMSDRPFTVAPDEPLVQVLEVMLERKIGSVLIMNSRGVVSGIFTTNDALEMLRALVLLGERERDLQHEAPQGQQAA